MVHVLVYCYVGAVSSPGSTFFFQAEDGIRDLVRSRGLGDVYKRQALVESLPERVARVVVRLFPVAVDHGLVLGALLRLSLIHI